MDNVSTRSCSEECEYGYGDRMTEENGVTTTTTTTTTLGEKLAELKAKRIDILHDELKSRHKLTVTKLCDAKQENCRLSITVCELEARLCECSARIEAERFASQAVEREQTLKIRKLKAGNRSLAAAVSASVRQKESVVQSVLDAESIVLAAKRQAKSAVRAAEREADLVVLATERQNELAVQSAVRLDEQRSVLSSAVEDLQSVLSSSVTELRLDVLHTVIEKLQFALATTGDGDRDEE